VFCATCFSVFYSATAEDSVYHKDTGVFVSVCVRNEMYSCYRDFVLKLAEFMFSMF
jgi:hypothetical protein